MLEIENLSKTFRTGLLAPDPVPVLCGINLKVPPGEILGLVGRSGEGKSTMARIIMGREKPDRGHILWKGKDIFTLRGKEKRAYRSQVQMISQNCDTALNPHDSVENVVGEIFLVKGRKAHARITRKKITMILEGVGLDAGHLDRYPYELSGGERQRVMVARTMALAPDLVIADEATASLDVTTQARIMNLMCTAAITHKTSLIIISHDMDLVRAVCHRAAILEKGTIVWNGPACQLPASLQSST
ncbi:ABC transporter ATP-binding protein [Desulfocicer niacini]